MPPEPNRPPDNAHAAAGSAPPPLLATPPPPARRLTAMLLSLFLGLFIADGVFSLAENSLMLFWGRPVLIIIPMLVSLLALLMALAVYGLMALVPAIPKRWFVPLTLFYPAMTLLGLWLAIYFYERIQLISWIGSGLQVVAGLWVLFRFRSGGKFHWQLVPATRLVNRNFSWRNLIGFVAANLFILLPALLIFLFVGAGLAVDHFTGGFMSLHPGSFSVQTRKYVRADGKTIHLFPMSHVAEEDFYQKISQTFPTNSLILMEGVTDEKNLLTNKITYKRMAKSLGLAEQHEKFAPTRGEMVPADIDVDQFSTNTLTLLNLVMLVHAQGVNAGNLATLLQYSPAPDIADELFDDLLTKRNRHLLGEIKGRLSESEYLIVPWGVAHMPGISEDIQKSGFHLKATQEYTVIRFFHAAGKPGKPAAR